ncbi:MAG: methylenetetrahydrofolate reductase, partial [Firmicutes bacterium]|nr:methylenetetrahydrofolate reductase [Bacillota bacterium]
SVTYGANGGTRRHTFQLASDIQTECGVTALAHITCVTTDRAGIHERLDDLKSKNIENVLALRGDIPEGCEFPVKNGYLHANELAADIKAYGDFCVGGACYPEGHPEAPSKQADMENLKRKQDAGCEFFTTQMFFDNEIFYRYLYKLRGVGVTVPVIAGIMPVTNAKQMERIISLSDAFIPRSYVSILDKYGDKPEALKQASIAYTTAQIIDLLANGINNIHIYAMNKPDVAKAIQDNLSELVPSCSKQS